MEDELFQSEDDSSVDSVDDLEEEYRQTLLEIKENDYDVEEFYGSGDDSYIQNMTDESWEEFGRDISNNTHLTVLELYSRALNDQTMTSLFRGLTKSTSIKEMIFNNNALSTVGVRSMMPFLQSASKLRLLSLDYNNDLQSEGFNKLFRALHHSPVAFLRCSGCGIKSIEIDSEQKPQHLEKLFLDGNSINADGCRELAKLLTGGDAVLNELYLDGNKIDDQGVDILTDALHENTSLRRLSLENNDVISLQVQIKLLKLVNDISSIKATLQSNQTLSFLRVNTIECRNDVKKQIQWQIDMATCINGRHRAAGHEKVIRMQLNSSRRSALAELQGVSQSLYCEISPLHLPEVLALVRFYHGLGELYLALKSSIAGVVSTVNRKQCLMQQRAQHEAMIAERRAIIAQHRTKVEAIEAEIEAIDEAGASHIGSESRRNKRRRA